MKIIFSRLIKAYRKNLQTVFRSELITGCAPWKGYVDWYTYLSVFFNGCLYLFDCSFCVIFHSWKRTKTNRHNCSNYDNQAARVLSITVRGPGILVIGTTFRTKKKNASTPFIWWKANFGSFINLSRYYWYAFSSFIGWSNGYLQMINIFWTTKWTLRVSHLFCFVSQYCNSLLL